MHALAKATLAAASLLAVAGCYDPKSSGEVTDTLDHAYGGRPANEFFATYGLPAGDFAGNDQTHVYRWASSQRFIIPAYVQFASYNTTAGTYQVADTYHGVTQPNYCELRIHTDMDDNIQRFAVAVDSIGQWSASACSELFSNNP